MTAVEKKSLLRGKDIFILVYYRVIQQSKGKTTLCIHKNLLIYEPESKYDTVILHTMLHSVLTGVKLAQLRLFAKHTLLCIECQLWKCRKAKISRTIFDNKKIDFSLEYKTDKALK